MQTLNELLSLLVKKGSKNVKANSERMGDTDLETLITAMEISPIKVESIDLSRNEITTKGALALAQFLQKSPQVREVDLQGNKIDDVGAKAFIELFRNPVYPSLFNIDENPCSKELINTLALLAQGSAFSDNVRRGLITGECDELDLTGIDYNKLDPRLVTFFVSNVNGLKSLILSGCSLRDAGAGIIGALVKESSLRFIDLSNNDISDVGLLQFINSADLEHHQTITSLSFSNNLRIGNYTVQELTKTLFQKNAKLTFFDLSGTSVTSKMRSVIDHECHLNKQPYKLKEAVVGIRTNDPSCTTINLQWEGGMKKAAYFIGPVLKNNTTLLELNLGNCLIGDEGVRYLVEALMFNCTLSVLAIPNNGITSRGAELLFECLKKHLSLQEVNVAGNEITDEAALTLLGVLRVNSMLKNVNVTNNFISLDYINEIGGLLLLNQAPQTIRMFVSDIESNEQSLTSVLLSGGSGEEYYNDSSVRLLCQALLLNNTVKFLDLSKNVVSDEGVLYIADMLLTNNTMTNINLAENSICNRGAQRLCDALRSNESLEVLDLSNNAINDVGVEKYLEMLRFNNFLKNINLENTGVSSTMYKRICEAVDLNKEPIRLKEIIYDLQNGGSGLSVVDLRREHCSRPLDDQSVETLSVHLKNQLNVKSLILRGNSIGNEGCKHIGHLIQSEGCGLLSIDLSYNPINDEDLAELSKGLLSPNCKLETLDLQGTAVTSAGIYDLADILKRNDSLQLVNTPEGVSADAFCTMNRELMVNAQPKSFKSLLERIEANENISEVCLRNPDAPFTDSACQLLSASLVKNTNVASLDFSRNQLTSDCVPFLVEALSCCPKITSVDLSDNRIDAEGGRKLMQFLHRYHHVVTLNLNGNPLTEDILNAIAELLYLNAGSIKLKDILLRYRAGNFNDEMINLNAQDEAYKLNDTDVRLLCEVMEGSKTLRAVDLGLNAITDLGCEMIADVLRQNQKIEALYLDYNPITDIGGEALYNALKINHQLHTLFLEGTNVPEEIWEDLLSLLHVNETPLKERICMRSVPLEEVDDYTQFKSTDYAVTQEKKVDEDALYLYEEPCRRIMMKS